MKKTFLSLACLLFLANSALAQPVTYGDPGKFIVASQYKQVQGISNAYVRMEYRASSLIRPNFIIDFWGEKLRDLRNNTATFMYYSYAPGLAINMPVFKIGSFPVYLSNRFNYHFGRVEAKVLSDPQKFNWFNIGIDLSQETDLLSWLSIVPSISLDFLNYEKRRNERLLAIEGAFHFNWSNTFHSYIAPAFRIYGLGNDLQTEKFEVQFGLYFSFGKTNMARRGKFAGDAKSAIKIANARFQDMGNGKVQVYYDLYGDPGQACRVRLSLYLPDAKRTVALSETNLRYDIGTNVSPGQGKRIEWNMKMDYPRGLHGEGFVFTVEATDGHAPPVSAYSAPGRLGNAAATVADNLAPIIQISRVDGAFFLKDASRGLKVLPNEITESQNRDVASEKITLRGFIEDDRGVAELKINNKPVRLQGEGKRKSFGIILRRPPTGRALNLEFVARDQAGNESRQRYQLSCPAKSAPVAIFALKETVQKSTQSAPGEFGEYWALIIGVSDYQHPSVRDLEQPARDAREVAEVLAQYYTFDPEHINVLLNPTRSQFIGALAAYTPSGKTPLQGNDNLLVFYAGHGYWDAQYDEGYWLPSDAEQSNRANWVSNSDIQKAFKAIHAQHILLLSDACFAGSMLATRQPFMKAIEEAYKFSSRKAITAGNLTEVPDRSVFKEYLVKRLRDNPEKYLDAGNLYNSIKLPVTANSPTRQRPIYGVIQQTGDEGGEFIFVRRE